MKIAVADTGRVELDEYVRWTYHCCQGFSNILFSLPVRTAFRHRNILNLDAEVRAFVDYNTSFTCFRDIKSLDLVFCHVVGCVLV